MVFFFWEDMVRFVILCKGFICLKETIINEFNRNY